MNKLNLYLFGKRGYEDEFVEVFHYYDELEAWLIKNEDANGFDKALVHLVVKGDEVPFTVVKKSTSVSWG